MAAALLLAVIIEAGVVALALWSWSSPQKPPAVVAQTAAKKVPLAVMLYGNTQQPVKVAVFKPKALGRKKVAVVAQQSSEAPEVFVGADETVAEGPPVIADEGGDGSSMSSAPVAIEGAGPGALEGRDLSRYAVLVLTELTANRRVPLQAARMRLQGSALLELSIGGHGELSGVRLVKTSGHAVLDEAALQTVRESAPFPPPPGNLVATFTVPIRYVE